MMRCPCCRERLHPKAYKPGAWWACEPCAIAGWSIPHGDDTQGQSGALLLSAPTNKG